MLNVLIIIWVTLVASLAFFLAYERFTRYPVTAQERYLMRKLADRCGFGAIR